MTRNLLTPDLLQYSEHFSTPETETLAALNRETNVKVEQAVMLSGQLQGLFLQMFSMAARPRTILEIGTYTGYSAICLAMGLAQGGRLHTIDVNEELVDIQQKYFQRSGMAERISSYVGKAADIIPTITGPFDLVFIDADKPNYALYFDLVIERVPTGGFILADNVLFEGEVLLPEQSQGKNARAMHKFNQKIKADGRVEHLLLPVRDGIMIMRKK